MPRLAICMLVFVPALAQAAVTVTADTTAAPRFTVANAQVVCMIDGDDAGHLVRETLAGQRDWLAPFGAENVRLEMDGGFAWEVVWNSWRSPGLAHNSDNPVLVDHRGFVYTGHDMQDDGLVIHLRDDDLQLEADVTWRLAEGDFLIRRLVTLRDPEERGHRLLRAFGRRGAIHDSATLVKKGEYGQPVAFTVQDGGAFLGTEWPAATNTIVPAGCGAFKLECYEDLEMQISKAGASGAWTVAAVTPQPYVRLWFDRYLDDIRVAPVKPYLLYNSWYDLRSRDYVKEHLTGEERDVMTSANILRVARDFQTKFCEPYGIPLDAFVLDDGWDVYESDWQLRGPEFPGGLHPVDDQLQKLGTTLGIWFGPTGGYSYRQRRIDWMQQHGYEVTANNMLCVGGAKYHDLLKRRNLDLIREHGVGYFKWDGVQFACNAEGHGHPVGLASRRAVLENVIDLSRTMRAANPDIYLNITSGTWLSPWWLMIANQIWMQGYDYGYADVPSLTDRDAAMTYRDHVLYDDFATQDCWFPISNLMTHGIIKGYLERLGGEIDPLDKFTDDVVLYFARGVSMWELYVSPNLLTDGEFKAIAESVKWAKDRFELLQHTVMIGGAPGKGEAYGYAHYLGERGIIAVRNPGLAPAEMRVVLDPAHGMAQAAKDLAVTRTYPWRGGLAGLHAAGDTLTLRLHGFETAVWEILPANEATEPLFGGGINYDLVSSDGKAFVIRGCGDDSGDRYWLLNPDLVESITDDGQKMDLAYAGDSPLSQVSSKPSWQIWQLSPRASNLVRVISEDTLADGPAPQRSAPDAFRRAECRDVGASGPYRCALLLESTASSLPPVARVTAERRLSGKPERQAISLAPWSKGEGWAWFVTEAVTPAAPDAEITFLVAPDSSGGRWAGRASTLVVHDQQPQTHEIVVTLKNDALLTPIPPRPLPAGVFRTSVAGTTTAWE
jgi:hypothetical protein